MVLNIKNKPFNFYLQNFDELDLIKNEITNHGWINISCQKLNEDFIRHFTPLLI